MDLNGLVPVLPGRLLTDQAWLSERVEQTGRQFGCSQRRVSATLWWYSASVVLLGPAVRELVRSAALVDLSPSTLRFTLLFNGYLDRVIPAVGPDNGALVDGPALGRHLDDVLGEIIGPLARAGRASEQSLWAIAADSLATRVLAETTASVPGPARAPELATAIAQAGPRLRPLPRFVDVIADPGAPVRRYVRRGSCCLLYRVPDGTCVSCPTQAPAERLERLRQHARAMG